MLIQPVVCICKRVLGAILLAQLAKSALTPPMWLLASFIQNTSSVKPTGVFTCTNLHVLPSSPPVGSAPPGGPVHAVTVIRM